MITICHTRSIYCMQAPRLRRESLALNCLPRARQLASRLCFGVPLSVRLGVPLSSV